MMMSILRTAACVLVAATVVACHSAIEPAGPPGLEGTIVARDLSISIGGPPTIHVKEAPSASCGVIYRVEPSTRISRRVANGQLSSASVSDLVVGRRVAVWADVVLESCPGQASASFVEVID